MPFAIVITHAQKSWHPAGRRAAIEVGFARSSPNVSWIHLYYWYHVFSIYYTVSLANAGSDRWDISFSGLESLSPARKVIAESFAAKIRYSTLHASIVHMACPMFPDFQGSENSLDNDEGSGGNQRRGEHRTKGLAADDGGADRCAAVHLSAARHFAHFHSSSYGGPDLSDTLKAFCIDEVTELDSDLGATNRSLQSASQRALRLKK